VISSNSISNTIDEANTLEDSLPIISTNDHSDYTSYFSFNTIFNDEINNNLTRLPYNTKLSFDQYIDPKDESVVELPSEDIAVKVYGYCVQITHQNNGTALSNDFFDLKIKKLFISNFYNDNKTVKIHDCNNKRSELIYVRDNKVQVVSLKGYTTLKVDKDENVGEHSVPTIQLLKNERIIFSKGTSQVVIKLVPYPPKLKSKEFFGIDEKLLKNVSQPGLFSSFQC
jgi:hypothetical protein